MSADCDDDDLVYGAPPNDVSPLPLQSIAAITAASTASGVPAAVEPPMPGSRPTGPETRKVLMRALKHLPMYRFLAVSGCPSNIVSPALVHLLEGCLAYDPARRWTAEQCLAAPWFHDPEEPPCEPAELPIHDWMS
jgi:serine/threonine protein kinase